MESLSTHFDAPSKGTVALDTGPPIGHMFAHLVKSRLKCTSPPEDTAPSENISSLRHVFLFDGVSPPEATSVLGLQLQTPRVHPPETLDAGRSRFRAAGPFRLLDLPREIRLKVYENLLISPILKLAPKRYQVRLLQDDDSRVYPQILNTCKKVYDEAQSTLYHQNTFCAPNYESWGYFLKHLTPRSSGMIKHLVLDDAGDLRAISDIMLAREIFFPLGNAVETSPQFNPLLPSMRSFQARYFCYFDGRIGANISYVMHKKLFSQISEELCKDLQDNGQLIEKSAGWTVEVTYSSIKSTRAGHDERLRLWDGGNLDVEYDSAKEREPITIMCFNVKAFRLDDDCCLRGVENPIILDGAEEVKIELQRLEEQSIEEQSTSMADPCVRGVIERVTDHPGVGPGCWNFRYWRAMSRRRAVIPPVCLLDDEDDWNLN